MPVTAADIKLYKPAAVNDTGSNGGRMSNTLIASAVKNALFPDVDEAERTSGITRYRKVFIKNENTANLAALSPNIFWENYSPGGDSFTFFPATQINLQSAITGSERLYGVGKLNANVSAGATTITVLTEGVALNMFRNSDKIRISDRATILAAGNTEFVTINGVPSYAGDIATIVLAAPGLANGYLAATTRVGAVHLPADIVATSDSVVVTTAGDGDFNTALPGLIMNSRGTVEQNWTVTFTSSTAFGVVGDTLGSVGTGSTAADFAPVNAFFSQPYFTIDKDAFTGTWANGDTLTFSTHPACLPYWVREGIPAGTGAQSNNTAKIGGDFQTP